jgi:nucleotide-binding universal stress UspA family protein
MEILMTAAINTILYATDLGKHTRPAFHMAVSLARKYNAKILFVYVIEPLSASAASMVNVYLSDTTVEDMYERSVDELHTKINERIKAFCEEELGGESYPGGEPEPYVLEGVPAPTIIKAAEKMNADLIVMGSHSHSTMDNLFIGSVANKVVNRSSKPVLLVPIKGD